MLGLSVPSIYHPVNHLRSWLQQKYERNMVHGWLDITCGCIVPGCVLGFYALIEAPKTAELPFYNPVFFCFAIQRECFQDLTLTMLGHLL